MGHHGPCHHLYFRTVRTIYYFHFPYVYQQRQSYQIPMAQVYQGYIWQKKTFLFSTDHSGMYRQIWSQKNLTGVLSILIMIIVNSQAWYVAAGS